MAAITVENAYKIFGRRPTEAIRQLEAGAEVADVKDLGTAAVIDVSFTVEPGEIFVVMGLSGSGKSTLIRMLNGLLPPSGGEIYVGDEEIGSVGDAKLRHIRQTQISMVFQHFALFPHRTVGENAAYGLEIRGVDRAERAERALQALEMVDIGSWADHYPSQLSGGMRQRVGLARALAADTEILLMDEAFSALDPLIRREMQDQLIELQQRLGKTIVFITHDLNEAMRLGDRIAVMRSGRIVQIGTSEQILREPANDYVAKFIADVDQNRVLTASAIMEQPASILGSEQGPRSAHKLLRESQNSWLVVLGRDRRPRGVVWEDDIARAVQQQSSELPWSTTHEMPVVPTDTPVVDLFGLSAQHRSPIVVVDDEGRFAGVVPRVTLLASAGPTNGNSTGGGKATPSANVPDPSEADPADGDLERAGGDVR